MNDIVQYSDRFGRLWIPTANSVVKTRTGVFGITFNQPGKLLLTYPNFDITWPQLPGGGVEKGENYEQALLREYNEEVGNITSLQVLLIASQQVNYYADDKKEFWQYAQHYYLVKIERAKFPRYGRWRSPENALAAWVYFLPSLSMHHVHKRMIKQVLRVEHIYEYFH